MVTPMDEYGNLDLDAMGRLLDWLLEEKTDAIVVNGTTGESATLDDNEKMEVIGFVIRHVNGRVPVIAGTGSNCTEHAVKLSREAEKLGADALLQVTPYYNKASQEGLVRHFTQVGDHVGIPMILYNVPSRTGVTIQPETYRILSEHPNIRGDVYKRQGLMRSTQIPDIHAIYVEKKEQLPFAYGAKGIGEIATIPTAPAAQGAYYAMDHILRTKLPMENTCLLYTSPYRSWTARTFPLQSHVSRRMMNAITVSGPQSCTCPRHLTST